jgi:hypothetical protein
LELGIGIGIPIPGIFGILFRSHWPQNKFFRETVMEGGFVALNISVSLSAVMMMRSRLFFRRACSSPAASMLNPRGHKHTLVLVRHGESTWNQV